MLISTLESITHFTDVKILVYLLDLLSVLLSLPPLSCPSFAPSTLVSFFCVISQKLSTLVFRQGLSLGSGTG